MAALTKYTGVDLQCQNSWVLTYLLLCILAFLRNKDLWVGYEYSLVVYILLYILYGVYAEQGLL